MKLKLEISAVLEHIYHYLTASLASSINLRTPGLGFTCAKMYEYLTVAYQQFRYQFHSIGSLTVPDLIISLYLSVFQSCMIKTRKM